MYFQKSLSQIIQSIIKSINYKFHYVHLIIKCLKSEPSKRYVTKF